MYINAEGNEITKCLSKKRDRFIIDHNIHGSILLFGFIRLRQYTDDNQNRYDCFRFVYDTERLHQLRYTCVLCRFCFYIYVHYVHYCYLIIA